MAKKYKLKTWPKVLVVLVILAAIGGYYAYQKHLEYLYTQTYEYKLKELNYKDEEIEILLNKLNDKELDVILEKEYDEFIPFFVNAKHFMFKNLDDYLSQVITQSEDFFKYHGTEGYDYDYIVSKVNTHTIHKPYSLELKTDLNDGYGILVNKYYELGTDYEPDDLVSVPLTYRYAEPMSIRSEVYDKFLEMWEAANNEGIYLVLESGYRSAKEQQEIYDSYEDANGTEYADSIAARPGYSEHQTGLSIDLYSKECASAKTFKDSRTYAWLIDNSYKYGFILRYPDGKSEITGYNYESWHYRYLGVDLAAKVHDSGLTFDEYYAIYMEK